MIDTTLLACPFCNGANIKAHAYGQNIGGEPDAFCQCQDCTTTGPNGTNEAEAIAAWNRRAIATSATAPTQQAVPALPVAWMHDAPGRVDVIHNEVKELWLRVGQPSSFYREKVPCKVEHYTIPLYAAPKVDNQPAEQGAVQLTDAEIKAAQEVFEQWFCEDLGLDMESDESNDILRKMLLAAKAAAPSQQVQQQAAMAAPAEPVEVAERLKATLAEFDEDLQIEVYAAWKREIADDKFRDNQEWMLAWDYFKAGWVAKTAAAQPAQAHCKEGDRCVCGGDTPGVRAMCDNWVKL